MESSERYPAPSCIPGQRPRGEQMLVPPDFDPGTGFLREIEPGAIMNVRSYSCSLDQLTRSARSNGCPLARVRASVLARLLRSTASSPSRFAVGRARNHSTTSVLNHPTENLLPSCLGLGKEGSRRIKS